MATPDAPQIVLVASCADTVHVGGFSDYIRAVAPEFDAKPLPSQSPSSAEAAAPLKRACPWSDDEDEDETSSSDSEPEPKRTRSLSSISTSSGRNSLGSLSSSEHYLSLPRESDNFVNFCKGHTHFVDKTGCILELPNKFQYLLLRPPRFGKTAFLSTLTEYYDVRSAKHFTRRFGSLAVVKKAPDPAPPRNQHLCLCFDLLHVRVYSDLAGIASRLRTHVSFILSLFVTEYAAELRLPATRPSFSGCDLETLFSTVFKLVKDCGHTLFVAVDNYDAPSRSRSSAHIHYPDIHTDFATPLEIEQLLDSHFWGPLMTASHVIDKLIVTGTVPLEYPALKSLTVSPRLQLACGFTEQEALGLMHSVLAETQDMDELRRFCGGYTFTSHDSEGGLVEPMLHPQLFLNWVGMLSLHHPPAGPDPFQLLSDLLKSLPVESDVPGAATVNGLIELLATGVVEDGGETDSVSDATKTTTWSTLYHAGAITFDRQLAGTLRVANSVTLSAIHSRVDTDFADRHELQWHFGTAWADFSDLEDPQLLPDLLTEVLRDLAQRSFGRKHEPNLRGVFELVMRNSDCSSLSHPSDPIILLPADVHRVQIPGFDPDVIVTMELKTLTLRGMWQATNLNDDEPTAEALETLHKELVELDEEALLARAYRVWSPERNAMETVLVGSFFDPKPKVSQLLAVGGARILLRKQRACEPEEANAQNADAVNETDDEAGSRSR
ncbi:hypothetical protein C8R47DRAFT_1238851 [Mycena vitilis]|nr:hypothetical protein C8R47DRAFT_1238851 [Mycena vitilis]